MDEMDSRPELAPVQSSGGGLTLAGHGWILRNQIDGCKPSVKRGDYVHAPTPNLPPRLQHRHWPPRVPQIPRPTTVTDLQPPLLPVSLVLFFRVASSHCADSMPSQHGRFDVHLSISYLIAAGLQ